MKITAIYATERKSISTTYTLAQKAINELRDDDEVYEFLSSSEGYHNGIVYENAKAFKKRFRLLSSKDIENCKDE